MRVKSTLSFAIIVVTLLGLQPVVCAQNWRNIVPLETKCDDVKKLFKVSKCVLPYMTIENPDYRIVLYFAGDSKDWRVPKDTVIRAFIDFTNVLRLDEYEKNFGEYSIQPESDAPEITVYKNQHKGVYLGVQAFGTVDKYISTITLSPSTENAKKYRCVP